MKCYPALPLLFTLVLSISVSAQQRTGFKEHLLKSVIKEQVLSHSAALSKPTSGQRLLSITEATDSIAFTWSGNRETVHENNPEELATLWSFYPLAPIMTEIPDFLRYSKQNFDSAIYYRGNGSWISYAVAKTYNSKDLVTRHHVYKWEGSPVYYYDMTYNDLDKLATANYFTDTAAVPVGNYVAGGKLSCFYNFTNGKLLRDEISDSFSGMGNYVWDYLADAAGRDTLIVLKSQIAANDFQYSLTYNSSGLIESCKIRDNSGLLVPVDSFGYNGIHPYPTYHISYMGGTPWMERHMTLNPNGDIQTCLVRTVNSTGTMDSSYRYSATYNSFNNPDTVRFENYANGQWNQGNTRVYHYQLTTTAIAGLPKASIALTAYPNPAGSIVHLSVGDASAANVTVFDINGRMLQQYGMTGTRLVLNTGALPRGIYTVKYESKHAVGSVKFVKE